VTPVGREKLDEIVETTAPDNGKTELETASKAEKELFPHSRTPDQEVSELHLTHALTEKGLEPSDGRDGDRYFPTAKRYVPGLISTDPLIMPNGLVE
jgi:hypothetical protein